MPLGLHRYHESGQSHFITFSCYHRKPKLSDNRLYDLFPVRLEAMRRQFQMRIYGYVVMPEHVHLLVSEPEHGTLADAMHYLKLSFSKQVRSLTGAQVSVQKMDANLGHQHQRWDAKPSAGSAQALGPDEPFWQKRYYDRNVRSVREFGIKLRYLHRNPVKRGLVKEPGDWKWSSFRHYAFREMGVVEIESEWTGRDRELKLTGGSPRIFLCPG
ncbi:MAG TPA: transposase [Candidatus Bathyarchaeia archaeon]|nr:transposase [Candidatus Bathyarchaeia archaeon]